MLRSGDGDAIVFATTNEENPSSFPGTPSGHWHYPLPTLTQYWRIEAHEIQPDLRVRFNGRRGDDGDRAARTPYGGLGCGVLEFVGHAGSIGVPAGRPHRTGGTAGTFLGEPGHQLWMVSAPGAVRLASPSEQAGRP